MMTADLARADVVLIGEQHDDPNTHRLELAVLEALARRQVAVTLSLEMFERDVQTSVDTYMSGSSGEDDFLKNSRPWPRYATDYRPLVEFARRQHWPVVAANVPRRIAADVAKSGKPAVDALTTADRSLAAADLQCPHDTYFDRFAEQMGSGGHQSGSIARLGGGYHDGAVLLGAMREGRDDGRIDRVGVRTAGRETGRRRSRDRFVPQRLRRWHRRASAAPPRRTTSGDRLDVAGRESRHRRSSTRGSEAGRIIWSIRSSSFQLPVSDSRASLTFHSKLLRRNCVTASFQPFSALSATTYATTAIAADARDMSIGSILSIVSAGVWWIRK